ncbi:MAG: HD domain-containing protein [Candidatus Limivivens sp.]|nr:HD domain-containing protein [Candidatus Limivivens sp.]
MRACVEEVLAAMMEYYAGYPVQINHFLKVYGFAKTIGQQEGLPGREQEILEVAAVVHDIGIKVSWEKYGDSSGKHQELEGPAVTEKLLKDLGYDAQLISRVSKLVGRHHTYTGIDGMDCQILIEADFLVNLYEEEASAETIASVKKKIFRTSAGIRILEALYEQKRND